MIKGRDNVLPRMDCTAMEFHSYLTSLDPLWNSTAMMGASEEPVSLALAAVPSCDIKLVFFISYATPAWPESGMGCGKPRPWRPWTAMEIHSYQGSLRLALEFHSCGGRTQLWNPRAGTNGQWRRVHPPLPCGRANPVSPGTCALFAQFLYDRAFPSPALACAWQSFSARLTIFSLGTKNAVRTNRRRSWRRMKNSIIRNWQDLLKVYVFSPDWTKSRKQPSKKIRKNSPPLIETPCQ
jgi:hypothetical protein